MCICVDTDIRVYVYALDVLYVDGVLCIVCIGYVLCMINIMRCNVWCVICIVHDVYCALGCFVHFGCIVHCGVYCALQVYVRCVFLFWVG